MFTCAELDLDRRIPSTSNPKSAEANVHIVDSMLKEFNAEVIVTKKILDRVPEDKLAWRPHQRSMSLGQLAIHIATVPGGVAIITRQNSFDVAQGSFTPPQPNSLQEISAALQQTIQDVRQTLEGATEQTAELPWCLKYGERELMTRPRIEVWRSVMLNHWYHHRGQLAIYLRLLDIPVPSIYGPTADESPFA
jgi:uncharacterized damage-inducible protein DinB